MSFLHTHIGSQPRPEVEAACCHHGMARRCVHRQAPHESLADALREACTMVWAACTVLDGLAMPAGQGANTIRPWSGVDRAVMRRKQDRSSGQPA